MLDLGIVLGLIAVLAFGVNIFLTLSEETWLWRCMLILGVTISSMFYLLVLRKRRIENFRHFREQLWDSNEYTKDEGLCIYLKSGKIELSENGLSKFLIFKDAEGYVLNIPFFNWWLEVGSKVIPFSLKFKFFKRQFRRSSDLRAREVFKILTKDEKKKILFPVLIELFFLIAYYVIYSLFKRDIAGEDSFVASFYNLLVYGFALFWMKVLFTELTNLTVLFKAGIGLPKIEDEKYVYHTEGMVVKISSKDVKISYDEERSILFTDISGFRYARKLHKSLYLGFLEKTQQD